MKSSFWSNTALLLLSVIFSTALFFAFIELPGLLDEALQERFGFPQFDHGLGDINALKTELYIQGLHLRWIGYGSLILILALIITGFATRKTGWALAGAVGLFIPVFGQFALSMFFLAGLGFLRVGWLPFLDIQGFQVLDLGQVIYIPYWILMWFFGLFHWNAHMFLSYLFMASGAFLFTWGVLVWFQSRYSREKVASSRIYRISRHPQYLGWILWSYGFILFTPLSGSMKITWSIPSSFPWLLMAMTIVGICMAEEIRMMKLTGGTYAAYRKSAPFLLPLPRWFSRIAGWPARRIAGGGYPESNRQVFWITLVYTGIFTALSLIWALPRPERTSGLMGPGEREKLNMIVEGLDQMGEDRRGIYARMEKIPEYGQEGLKTLQGLAGSPNPHVREFSIQLLGEQHCTDAEEIILKALRDSVKRVRSSGILASAMLPPERATDSLIRLLEDPGQDNNLFHVYGSLGSLGQPKSIPYLAMALEEGPWFNQQAALNAIMEIDTQQGVEYAIRELEDEETHVRQNAVTQCILSGDPRVVEPLRALSGDPDFEVRFFARQGVKRILRQGST